MIRSCLKKKDSQVNMINEKRVANGFIALNKWHSGTSWPWATEIRIAIGGHISIFIINNNTSTCTNCIKLYLKPFDLFLVGDYPKIKTLNREVGSTNICFWQLPLSSSITLALIQLILRRSLVAAERQKNDELYLRIAIWADIRIEDVGRPNILPILPEVIDQNALN